LTHLFLEIANWAARALAIPGVRGTWKYGSKRWQRRQFKKIFGREAQEHFLAFGTLEINPSIAQLLATLDQQLSRFPFTKHGRPDMSFSAQKVASSCELRAVAYIGPALSLDGDRTSRVFADDSVEGKLDIDFISFGAMSNLMTVTAFANPANQFVDYDRTLGFFASKKNGQRVCNVREGYDYGVILKIHPEQFPQRTWIVCAGVGEWGTSGSAWFLAHNWGSLAKKLKDSDQFACVIEVRPGQDESAVFRTLLS